MLLRYCSSSRRLCCYTYLWYYCFVFSIFLLWLGPQGGRVQVTVVEASFVVAPLLSKNSYFRRHRHHHHPYRTTATATLLASSSSSASTDNNNNKNNNNNLPLQNLNIAIVGGGPSGLVLAHKLLPFLDSNSNSHIHLIEARSEPRVNEYEQGRAYALGVGIRGRSAITSIDIDIDNDDKEVWKAITKVGFASEKFDLHVGPFKFRLRDTTSNAELQPSLLLFQSDLCAALLQELLSKIKNSDNNSNNKLQLHFDTAVTAVDLQNKVLTCSTSSADISESSESNKQQTTTRTKTIPFDLIVGCDGVNSIVRRAIDETCEAFKTTQKVLQGQFKTVRLPQMPTGSNNKLDPTAVALILPKSGTTTAFVEPTTQNTCCVLFAGSNTTDPILASNNVTELQQVLQERFPFLLLPASDDDKKDTTTTTTTRTALIDSCAQQLAATQRPSTASSVQCNIYHYDATAVLVGDAAHATGGVSGQGVNSALVDSQRLAEALVAQYDAADKTASLQRALLTYSQQQVPEGKALYELSFPPPPTTARQRIVQTFKMARDTFFGGRFGIGRPPIQTVLTTSLQSFADIRRNRQGDYPDDQSFPDQAWWNATLAELDAKARSTASSLSSSSSSAERATAQS